MRRCRALFSFESPAFFFEFLCLGSFIGLTWHAHGE